MTIRYVATLALLADSPPRLHDRLDPAQDLFHVTSPFVCHCHTHMTDPEVLGCDCFVQSSGHDDVLPV